MFKKYKTILSEEVKALTERVETLTKEKSEREIRLEKELERGRVNSIRLQQKYEQDFDFHKQMVVNDCGRHIEELQEEHREHIRNIERKLSVDQRKKEKCNLQDFISKLV